MRRKIKEDIFNDLEENIETSQIVEQPIYEVDNEGIFNMSLCFPDLFASYLFLYFFIRYLALKEKLFTQWINQFLKQDSLSVRF